MSQATSYVSDRPAPAQWLAQFWRLLPVLAQRLLSRALMMLFVALIVFVVLRVMPVDPLGMLMPPNATKADVAALSHALGLDLPLHRQFMIWLGNVLHGDFGRSIQSGRAVGPLILNALPTTLQLIFCGLSLGIAVGLGSGILAFRYRGTRIESGIDLGNSVAISIPEFLWAILMILGLGIGLQLLPFLGPINANITVPRITGFLLLDSLLDGSPAAFGSALQHLVMPSLAMALGIAPPIMRILRSSLMEVYNEDYIVAARLRGTSENRILLRHALRNAALPTVSMIGLQAGTVIGGTLLLETIYGFPGIGSVMVTAIANHDLPVIQGLALTYALSVLVMNMMTDTLLLIINPRLRAS
ncbi:ABC transporter permease [Herbaspirillum lusitanum]|uniref:ABC transporter permease n=1 Tax=Herbaspirillum lusitanum TaxID=213312 RepID=A0ABW9A7W2_9BURK